MTLKRSAGISAIPTVALLLGGLTMALSAALVPALAGIGQGADVGGNCDFWCLFGSFGAGAGMGFGFGSGFGSGSRERRESGGRDFEGWKRDWKEYKDSGGHGPPPPPPPWLGPGPSDPDWMMKFYKAYKSAADYVGGPEATTSLYAGGKA